ncbi:hypothetical protein GA0074692_3380 [Micromonospora pallida]|uniref:Caspase domain-containing protein n=1 Tax=Micromonospora pallida TaxID=145854 RepID=A0A1C6ST50_9ACTN|nr:hypothetical protein [Micromonospora pallida]SCL32690.1 hypothetical protein GA0074692_3380 [Micromonospora pallida]
MTANTTPRRHPLLPVLAGSRAVLVGRDTPDPDADHGFGHGYESAVEATRALARTLTSPTIGTPFLEAHTEQLVRGESPDAVIDAVRRAAAAASDTLLFSYAATGPEHWETPEGAEQWTEDPGSLRSVLRRVADLMWDSAATRLVVLLDCGSAQVAVRHFTRPDRPAGHRHGAQLSLLGAGRVMLFGSEIDPFTSTLTRALQAGVDGGPEALNLVALGHAVEAKFTELRYQVENEYIPGAKQLFFHGGHEVALGINRAFPPDDRDVALRYPPRYPGAFFAHPDAVSEAEGY